jgi:hypothetical protein
VARPVCSVGRRVPGRRGADERFGRCGGRFARSDAATRSSRAKASRPGPISARRSPDLAQPQVSKHLRVLREVGVDTLTLTEVDGRTTLAILVEHASKAERDGHIASGMETGMQEAMDALEQVAVSLR